MGKEAQVRAAIEAAESDAVAQDITDSLNENPVVRPLFLQVRVLEREVAAMKAALWPDGLPDPEGELQLAILEDQAS